MPRRRQSHCAIMLFGPPNCMMSSGTDARPHDIPNPPIGRGPHDRHRLVTETVTDLGCQPGDISLAGRPAILMARGSTIPHIMFRRHQNPRAIMLFGPPNCMMSSGTDADLQDIPETSDPCAIMLFGPPNCMMSSRAGLVSQGSTPAFHSIVTSTT